MSEEEKDEARSNDGQKKNNWRKSVNQNEKKEDGTSREQKETERKSAPPEIIKKSDLLRWWHLSVGDSRTSIFPGVESSRLFR
jgi:hypothetical protein